MRSSGTGWVELLKGAGLQPIVVPPGHAAGFYSPLDHRAYLKP